MLFFIDESWQHTTDKRYRVGILSAIPLNSKDYNDISVEVFNLRRRRLGPRRANEELKGYRIFKKYFFRMEKKGITNNHLNLARDVFSLCDNRRIKIFASVTHSKKEVDLACANAEQLERPFFFLFERINQFMNEYFPDLIAKIIFDDRGRNINQRISKSVSNFFHKSQVGRSFDRILKAPFFAISSENVGIQIADLVGHIIGRRFTGDRIETAEFFRRAKTMQYESRELVGISPNEKPMILRGIKVIRERSTEGDFTENGDL